MKFKAYNRWFSLASCCPLILAPQEVAKPAAAGRVKLGFVLEGGGALGLAHIGVLQWFEEHRIPVSYVAGTSMGGLVGGIYATGRSPAEIKEITDGIDWDDVLRGETPFKDLSFRRKQDAHEVPNSLEFGLRKGCSFPEASIQVNRSLSSLTNCPAIFRTQELQRSPYPVCLCGDGSRFR